MSSQPRVIGRLIPKSAWLRSLLDKWPLYVYFTNKGLHSRRRSESKISRLTIFPVAVCSSDHILNLLAPLSIGRRNGSQRIQKSIFSTHKVSTLNLSRVSLHKITICRAINTLCAFIPLLCKYWRHFRQSSPINLLTKLCNLLTSRAFKQRL